MRTTVTPQQRVLATLVKWTSLFLILLAVMAGTISGELPIGRTNLSRTSSVLSSLNFHCPDATPDQTPSPSHGTCAYLPTTTGQCASSYTFQGGICFADPIRNGGPGDQPIPPSQAPPTETPNPCTGDFTPVQQGGQTVCHNKNGFNISQSCAQGFVNVSDNCYSNQPFDLFDASSDNCTLSSPGEEGEGSGEEGGVQIYWCPYKNGTLNCIITGTSEQCTMTGTGGVVGYFTCQGQGLASGYPTGCIYYGTNTAATTKGAFSTCANGSCTIMSCLDSVALTYYAILCPPNTTNDIQVRVKETCTAQVGGQKRVCDYNSTNGQSDKRKLLSIACNDPDPNALACTVTGPYNIVLTKLCTGTQQNQDNQATCNIAASAGGSELWVEQCTSTGGATTIPDCQVFSSDGNLLLGTMHCDGPQACTITDDASNVIKITCGPSSGASNSSPLCHSDTPDCPHSAVPTAAPITEATIACDASLIADMLMYGAGTGPAYYTIVYPLSQTELEFVLKTIGAGSQQWLPENNLPTEKFL